MSLTSTPPRLGKDLSLGRESSTGTYRDGFGSTARDSMGGTVKDLGRFGRAKKVLPTLKLVFNVNNGAVGLARC